MHLILNGGSKTRSIEIIIIIIISSSNNNNNNF